MVRSQQSSPTKFPNDLLNEAGQTTLALLACLSVLFVYLLRGREIFLEKFPAAYDTLTILVLITISCFTIGCTIHMIVIGAPSKRQLKKRVVRKASDMKLMKDEAFSQLEELEQCFGGFPELLSWSGLESLKTAQRILRALSRRCHEVEQLIKTNTVYSLAQAYELLKRPLVVNDNCVDHVLSSSPINALGIEHLELTLAELIQDVHRALSDADSYARSLAKSTVKQVVNDPLTDSSHVRLTPYPWEDEREQQETKANWSSGPLIIQ